MRGSLGEGESSFLPARCHVSCQALCCLRAISESGCWLGRFLAGIGVGVEAGEGFRIRGQEW